MDSLPDDLIVSICNLINVIDKYNYLSINVKFAK